MKRILWTLIIGTMSQTALADTTSYICTSASGNVQVLEDEVIVKTVGLGGPVTIELATAELKMSSRNLMLVDKSEEKLRASCRKTYLVKNKTLVREVTFSKKDGSNIFTDDTPQSSLKEITTKVLCEVRTIGEWPCH